MTAQQLKNSILQLAVQGKLVPQGSNDEPASVLLEHIRAEKERLAKEGKLKKEKPLLPITEDEIHLDNYAQSGDKTYGFQVSAHTDATGGIVTFCVELESMFFDAPENITLHFENQSNIAVEIPLALQR